MNKTFLSFINVILFFVLITFGAILVSRFFKDKTEFSQFAKKASEQSAQINPSPLPPYAPDWIKWEHATPSDPQSLKGLNISTFLSSKSAEVITDNKLAGNEWISVNQYKTDKELISAKDVTAYYLKEAEKNNWRTSILIGTKSINGIAASGPLGNALSFLRIKENSLQILILATVQDKPSCPCTTTTRVFLSDPIPLDTILKK